VVQGKYFKAYGIESFGTESDTGAAEEMSKAYESFETECGAGEIFKAYLFELSWQCAPIYTIHMSDLVIFIFFC
jgi:hypothetical protein